jgi:hypothetical protein
MWAFLAFFAADNVLTWIASPIMFYPAILILGMLAMIHSLGLMHIFLPIVKQTIVFTLRKLRIDSLFC